MAGVGRVAEDCNLAVHKAPGDEPSGIRRRLAPGDGDFIAIAVNYEITVPRPLIVGPVLDELAIEREDQALIVGTAGLPAIGNDVRPLRRDRRPADLEPATHVDVGILLAGHKVVGKRYDL